MNQPKSYGKEFLYPMTISNVLSGLFPIYVAIGMLLCEFPIRMVYFAGLTFWVIELVIERIAKRPFLSIPFSITVGLVLLMMILNPFTNKLWHLDTNESIALFQGGVFIFGSIEMTIKRFIYHLPIEKRITIPIHFQVISLFFAGVGMLTALFHNTISYHLFYIVEVIVLILQVGCYVVFVLLLGLIRSFLKKTDWITLTDVHGKAVGSIPKMPTQDDIKQLTTMVDAYIPILRIYVVWDEYVFLIPSKHEDGSTTWDVPLMDIIFMGESPCEKSKEMAKMVSKDGADYEPRFLFKYPSQFDKIKWLIYVFTLRVDSSDGLNFKEFDKENRGKWHHISEFKQPLLYDLNISPHLVEEKPLLRLTFDNLSSLSRRNK